jgi:hypothetical protein
MKKNKIKKLELHRESLLRLEGGQLSDAVGGATIRNSCTCTSTLCSDSACPNSCTC